MLKRSTMLLVIISIIACCNFVLGHAHTHIGINQDQQDGNGDDDKLWFFSMGGTPGWPNWGEPLELVYQESGLLSGYYVCEELECWHSAHPPHGNWQLGGEDELVTPDWEIGIERVSYSSGFITLDDDTLLPVLTSDGSRIIFDHQWMTDKYNENGTLGAWGFHAHMLFAVNGSGVGLGETFSATFIAVDEGSTGYSNSEEFTMNFVTVPEPLSVLLLGIGGVLLRFRKNGK